MYCYYTAVILGDYMIMIYNCHEVSQINTNELTKIDNNLFTQQTLNFNV